MATNGTVQYEVIASLNEAIAAQRLLTKEINNSVRQIASDLGSLEPAGKKGAEGLGSLTEWLQHHRREMRAEAGLTKILARDMGALGLEADGAGGAISHLLSAFAIGGTIGGGIALVKFLADAIREAGAEAEQHAKVLHQVAEDAGKIREAARAKGTPAEEFVAKESQSEHMRALLARERAEEKALAEVRKGKEGDQLRASQAGLSVEEYRNRLIEAQEERVKDVRSQISGLTAEIGKQYKAIRTGEEVNEAAARQAGGKTATGKANEQFKKDSEEAQKEEEKASEERIRQAEAARLRIAQGEERYQAWASQQRAHWAKIGTDEETRARLEASQALEQVAADDAATRLAIEEGLQRRLKEIQERRLAEEFEATRSALAKEAAEREREFQRQVAEVKHFLAPLKSAVDQVFTGLVDGSLNLEQVMAGIWKGIASMVIGALTQMAEESIANALVGQMAAKAEALSTTQGHIAEAVAGAAASQAFIPIVGPALAMESAAGMLGTLEGMTAPLLAMDVGTWRIPQDMPILAHQGEKIVPRSMSEAIDRGDAVLGSGGGPGSLGPANFTIYAFDGPDVERTLLKIRDRLIRNGRWTGV